MKHFRKVKFWISFTIFAFLFLEKSFAQNSSPLVFGIEAMGVSNSLITVTWNLPLKTQNFYINSLLIYRDTRPITSYSQISSLKPIANLPRGTVSFNDRVSDRCDYYYAVISLTMAGSRENEDLYYDEELDSLEKEGEGAPYAMVLPGVNATVNGAKVKTKKADQISLPKQKTESEKKTYENSLRKMPLPFIDILGDEQNHESTISLAAQEEALSLTKKAEQKQLSLEPYIFEEDLVSPASGDEYLLFEVLRTSFIKKNYTKAIRDLNNFLAQNRNEKVAKRARFYLGESYYFTGDYKAALSKFLELQEDYPAVSRKWSESALDLYEIPE